MELTCLYCHTEIPDEKRANYEDVKLLANPEVLCVGCHGRITENQWHTRHLRKPPVEIANRIKEINEILNNKNNNSTKKHEALLAQKDKYLTTLETLRDIIDEQIWKEDT